MLPGEPLDAGTVDDVSAVTVGATTAASAGPLSPGTLTFLFTDIEGSTQHWEQEPDAMRPALEAHDGIVREVIEAHGGHVFSTAGDGFGAVFGRAAEAATAAAETQRRLAGASWPAGRRIAVRIGLHTGEATERGGDYFGPAVNLAARLMAAGHGGQVLVSGTTAEIVDRSVSLDYLGEYQLRDITAPVRIHQLVADGLATSFPPLRTQFPGNLVRPVTRWFGSPSDLERHRELREITDSSP